MSHFDLLIIGGGMVGASLACALRPLVVERGLRLGIIESQPLAETSEAPQQPSYDARSTALSWGTRLIYERLGLWSGLAAGATPIHSVEVSDRGHFGTSRLHSREMGTEALGYVVENRWLGSVLHAALQNDPSIEWLCPAQVEQIVACETGMQLGVRDGEGLQQLTAGLTLLADGGRSELARQLGIRQHSSDYQQRALIANVTTGKPHRGVAYERFTDEGPMALLPLSGGRSALVWTLPETEAGRVMALDDAAFLQRLQARFGYRLGRLERVGERFSYPLSLKWATEQVRPGLVVMGNAAHSLHPVAGQGYNLALRDLMTLVRVLQQGLAEGRAAGELALLRRYLELQQQDQWRTVGFSDWVVRLFSGQRSLLSPLRGLGLLGLELTPPAKHWFTRQAMGLVGEPGHAGRD
ncbi:2-octaprenyl-6-methoxyphenyl hydroxylase [Aestuariirhabdus litorea]|uniref:2-octaprenyl-6-methoxyphenyl hydroxylase n=1 Tax=Aestuariirhabdus litorea TaxID=2528527 RepID=A0A3P3VJU7_9GAMM|nr:2-octaprenyl-6-methoxyphenyl hydroxylase [Aestuariirhabdus litorea]RRJ82995.1 2-octaprenyl-6-methoxyphenyl hydroxylase [Aestuariirhabdus litorea]RWW93154.1 2-octaprenyl-6-methoxyphenyl hydroxylase [Endozoicomonadaceae bacterium GTF-13]